MRPIILCLDSHAPSGYMFSAFLILPLEEIKAGGFVDNLSSCSKPIHSAAQTRSGPGVYGVFLRLMASGVLLLALI